MASQFTVAQNDVVRNVVNNTELLVTKVGGGALNSAHFTYLRKAAGGDVNLTPVDDALYLQPTRPPSPPPTMPRPSGQGGGNRPPRREDRPGQGGSMNVFEEKVTNVENAMELFDNLASNLVLSVKAFDGLLAKPAVEPGMMDAESTKAVSDSLRQYQMELMNDDSNEAITAFLLGFLQNLVTYYTSHDVDTKLGFGVHLGYGDNIFLPYAQLKSRVESAVSGKGYDNPLRQYARMFTNTVINLINNGKLLPNYKVLIQHGVPKKFVAYCIDFLRPNYLTYNPNQIRAWQLAQQSAFDRKSSASTSTLHNTKELQVGGI